MRNGNGSDGAKGKTGGLLKKEFDILYFLLGNDMPATQREIVSGTGLALGTVNHYLHGLEDRGFVSGGMITERGLGELDAYKVHNAIILAAGVSSRLLPLSLERPKGLLKVHGEPLLERQICQLQEVGITDITVVVGYMKEKMYYLADRYGVEIVENPEYLTRNNTVSLKLVLEKLGNTYLCASDHYFTENIFESHCFASYYTTTLPLHAKSTDLSYELGKGGRFSRLMPYRPGEPGLVGPCCFREADAAVFASYLERALSTDPAAADQLWEELLVGCIGDLEMYPRFYDEGIIYEFNNIDELKSFDSSYIENVNSTIIRDICDSLQCTPADLHDFEPMKVGLTNTSFKFFRDGEAFIYRYPGEHTSRFLSRACEAQAETLARELDLDPTIVEIDPVTGSKLSRFIEGCGYIDPYDTDGDQKAAMGMLRRLHDRRAKGDWDLDFIRNSNIFIDILTHEMNYDFSPFEDIHSRMTRLSELVDAEGREKVLCHNDTWFWNFLKDRDGNLYLIDWEYAGNNYPAADVADFVISLDFTDGQYIQLATVYEGHELSFEEQRHYHSVLAMCLWFWFVWAIYTEMKGTVVEDMQLWYRKALHYLDVAEEMHER